MIGWKDRRTSPSDSRVSLEEMRGFTNGRSCVKYRRESIYRLQRPIHLKRAIALDRLVRVAGGVRQVSSGRWPLRLSRRRRRRRCILVAGPRLEHVVGHRVRQAEGRMSIAARSQLHEFKLARSTCDIMRPGTDGGHSQRDLNS